MALKQKADSKQAAGSPAAANDLSERIARKAYELWERGGRVQGQDVQHWLEAERLIRQETQGRR